MLLIDSLAEEKILSAIRRGDLEGLAGEGKPLVFEDDSGVPEALRVAYRVLKNAACLPPELTLRNEIQQVEALLDQAELDAEEQAIRRRLCFLKARLALRGHDGDLLARERGYREKLVEQLTGDARRDALTANTDSRNSSQA